MNVYFKNKKTFETIEKATPQSWNVPLIASSYETGTIVIPKEKKKDYSDNFVYISDYLLLVTESTPQEGTIELKVSDPAMIFSRQIFYPQTFPGTYGELIADAITSNFINCADAEYRLPYISVLNEDTTILDIEEPESPQTTLYSLVDVINTARSKGVILDFNITGPTSMQIHIHTSSMPTHNLKFQDGKTDFVSESYSRVKVAKITARQSTDVNNVTNDTTWYLSKNGDISQTIPADRAKGDWIYLSVNKDENVETKVRNEFKKNTDGHKIEFYSDRKYGLWDNIQVTVDDELFKTHIIGIYFTSDNDRLLYKCGDLATTLTEKVKKEEKRQVYVEQKVEQVEEEVAQEHGLLLRIAEFVDPDGSYIPR